MNSNLFSLAKLPLLFALLLLSFPAIAQDDNGDDTTPVNTYKKVRLGFYSHTNSYRQILLGFEDNNATEGIDPGYDAVNTFNLPNDMYFWTANTELFIQGVGYFNSNNNYPIGVRTNGNGEITIKLETTENMAGNQMIYLYDAVTNQYTNLKSGNFTVNVGTGTFNDRFSLRFVNQSTLGTDIPTLNNGVKVMYTNNDNVLTIQNNLSNVTAQTVNLYAMTGQMVGSWNIAKQTQSDILVPVTGFSKGAYIVNVTTDAGVITKKIAIR